MKLTQLKYALAVREAGSISAAARASHVSQPSLSEGLRLLEEELGVKLFERTATGAEPTVEGSRLLDQMKNIETDLKALEEQAEAFSSGDDLSGILRLGIISTVGPYLLPTVLDSLSDAYPDLELQIEEGLTENLLDKVDDHELDGAIIALPWERAESYRTFDLYDEPFMVAVPSDHPLAEQDHVSVEDINIEELFLLDEGHCLRNHSLEICQAPASEIRRTFRGTSLETVRELIAAGWGISLFPALAASNNDRNIEYRPLNDPEVRKISLATRNSSAKTEALQALGDFFSNRVKPALP